MAVNQAAKILRDMKRHRAVMDLDKGGLGEKLLNIACNANEANFDAGLNANGQKFASLDPGYFRWKELHALTTDTGFLEGVMGEHENFVGDRTITATEASSEFGADDQAKIECDMFSVGNPPGQPPRPFVGLTKEAEERSNDLLDKRLLKNT